MTVLDAQTFFYRGERDTISDLWVSNGVLILGLSPIWSKILCIMHLVLYHTLFGQKSSGFGFRIFFLS